MSAVIDHRKPAPFWSVCGPLTWRMHRAWSMAARAEGEWPSRERFALRHRPCRPVGWRLRLLKARLALRAARKHRASMAADATSAALKAISSTIRQILARWISNARIPRFSFLNIVVLTACVIGAYAAGSATPRHREAPAIAAQVHHRVGVTKVHTEAARHIAILPAITVSPPPHFRDPAGVTASDLAPDGALWTHAAQLTDTNPLMLYAVALVETRRSVGLGAVAPDPYVVRINGSVISGGWGQVSDAIERARSTGAKIQDVGIMQVYYPAHRTMESNPVRLLDPWRNVVVGATILRRCMSTATSMVDGFGCYHSPNPTLAIPYGRAVMTVYRRLVGMHRAQHRDDVGAPAITSVGGPTGRVPHAEGAGQ